MDLLRIVKRRQGAGSTVPMRRTLIYRSVFGRQGRTEIGN